MEVCTVAITKEKRVVVQSNKLIEARYALTIPEQRLVLTLISLISPEDTKFKKYEISISEFQNILGKTHKGIYGQIKETLKKLASRVIYIPEGRDYIVSNWFSFARYISDRGCVQISFDENLKPYLLELKNQFTKLNLFLLAKFNSPNAVRIYMLLKQYEKIGVREIELSFLRDILEIGEKEYPKFADFRKRILNQAKKEFEAKDKETGCYKSDITFDLETLKTGRKITRLRFIIKKQKYQSALPLDIIETPLEKPKTPAQQQLEYYGIIGKEAEKYLHEQTEAEILRCIDLLEQRKNDAQQEKVTNLRSYLTRLLSAKAGTKSPAEIEAEEEAKRQEKIRQEKARKEREAKEREKQKAQYQKAMYNEIDSFLLACDTEKKAVIIADFEASDIFLDHIKSAGFLYGFYQQNGLDDPISKSFFSRFIIDKYLPHLASFDDWLFKQKGDKKTAISNP